MRRIPIVAVFNNKGGVGKTMISCNFAEYVALCKLKVLYVVADRQGDGFRFITRGKEEASQSAVYKRNKYLSAIFHPMAIPKVSSNIDLMVVDCPPAIQIASEFDVDIWVVPITSRFSFENLFNIFPELVESGAKVVILINRKKEGGLRIMRKLQAAISTIPNVIVYDRGIEQNNAFKRMENIYAPIWKDPYCGKAGEDICELSHFLLGLCNFNVPKLKLGR